MTHEYKTDPETLDFARRMGMDVDTLTQPEYLALQGALFSLGAGTTVTHAGGIHEPEGDQQQSALDRYDRTQRDIPNGFGLNGAQM